MALSSSQCPDLSILLLTMSTPEKKQLNIFLILVLETKKWTLTAKNHHNPPPPPLLGMKIMAKQPYDCIWVKEVIFIKWSFIKIFLLYKSSSNLVCGPFKRLKLCVYLDIFFDFLFCQLFSFVTIGQLNQPSLPIFSWLTFCFSLGKIHISKLFLTITCICVHTSNMSPVNKHVRRKTVKKLSLL